MLVTFKSRLGSKVKLRVTVILFHNKVFSVNTSFVFNSLFILFTELSYPSHLCLAVLKPMALVYILKSSMNTVLFVNATIGFSENLFLVNYAVMSNCFIIVHSVWQTIMA